MPGRTISSPMSPWYADHGLVVDATPSHGLVSRAWSGAFVGAHTRVRRLRGVTSLQQDEMATLARSLNGNYSYLSAAASALLTRLRTPNSAKWTQLVKALVAAHELALTGAAGSSSPTAAAYCGELVDDLYVAVTNRSIVDNLNCFAAIPAAYSANTAEFVDVAVTW